MSKDYNDTPIKVPRFSEDLGFYTTPQRSKQMSRIRGKNTKPELLFRRGLWARGFRYRVDYKKLIGRPDIVLKKYKTVVFIDGEYWHGHNWETRKKNIKTNREFWIPKIERNMQRDKEVNLALTEQGYTIFRFWENDVKKHLDSCLDKVVNHLNRVKTVS